MKPILWAAALAFAGCQTLAAAQPPSLAEKKLRHRAWVMEHQKLPSLTTEAPFPYDRAENLVDSLRYDSLAEIESANLMSASLAQEPWSDSYWPIYAGVVANRYNDPAFPASMDWQKNERYLIAHLGAGPVNHLSPAEKYDLLVGDSGFTLSRRMIEEGKAYQDSSGKVASWMGICHGWAPASFMMDRAEHSVTVPAADGTPIELFPADIRALQSLLWANGEFETRYISGRCDTKDPSLGRNGRPTDPACRDTNPATWHLAIVNQIGVSRRSFIFDAEWSAEVWNQPVAGYSYHYLDARTRAPTQSLSEALLPVDASDEKRDLRSPGAKNYVYVSMDVRYMAERLPNAAPQDSAAYDAFSRVTYLYELELDESGRIVGGEWDENKHPDFLWAPAKDARALSLGDQELDEARDTARWAQGNAVPASWSEAARTASASSQPLARVVEQLVRWAR